MRVSRFGLVFMLLCACGAKEAKPVMHVPEAPSTEVTSVQDETPLDEPQNDPLDGVEWSPNPAENAAREGAEPAIDLEMGDGYTPVHVNGKPPANAPMACKIDKDCDRMRRPKVPGKKRCIKNTCVFIGDPPLDGNDIELF